MKKVILILPILLMWQVSNAQVTDAEAKLRKLNTDTISGWRTGGILSINLAQTSLINWAGGGQNSIAVNGLFNKFANYKNGKNAWDNSLDVGYGLLKQGQNTNFMKTDDKIDLLSKYGRQFSNKWYFAGLFNFRTQMAPGYNYPNDSVKISNFLAPAYPITAIGFDFKPNKYISSFIAPLTSKITIVRDQTLADAGAFGVEGATYDEMGMVITPGRNVRSEFGGYLRMIYSRNDYKSELLKNVSITTKLDLFSNYLNNPENIDVSWETLISMKVNKFIVVTINTHLVYDHDIDIAVDRTGDGNIDSMGPRSQFKQILGVGFSYKW
jgi:hypothetical protein